MISGLEDQCTGRHVLFASTFIYRTSKGGQQIYTRRNGLNGMALLSWRVRGPATAGVRICKDARPKIGNCPTDDEDYRFDPCFLQFLFALECGLSLLAYRDTVVALPL